MTTLELNIPFLIPVPVPVPLPNHHTTSWPIPSTTHAASPPPPPTSSTLLDANQLSQLQQQGYTDGLSRALAKSCSSFPLRLWIIDNSGSMNSADGNMLVATKSCSEVKSISCTRWKELQETVHYHAQMAGLLKAPTIFRLLNPPEESGLDQEFSVAADDKGEDSMLSTISEDLRVVDHIMSNVVPSGSTPLSKQVKKIREDVAVLAPSLREQGKRIAVILATDGLPSNERGVSGAREREEFTNELRSLQGLPVWIVIRLCTNDKEVLNYYNRLDDDLELSMKVLDNFTDEAGEIYAMNPWLNYSLPIHRMREFGFQHRVFDLLDERKLTISELKDYCVVLFGEGNFVGVPAPEADFKGFIHILASILKWEKLQWHVTKKKMKPWLSLKKMSAMYSDADSCVVM